MQLTYRGNSYEVHTPIQLGSDSKDRSKVKLIYRGVTIYVSSPVKAPEVDKTDWPTATLIYRGNIYERKIQPPNPYQKTCAINWRWKFARS